MQHTEGLKLNVAGKHGFYYQLLSVAKRSEAKQVANCVTALFLLADEVQPADSHFVHAGLLPAVSQCKYLFKYS
jgi:hypothetical protein